MKNKYATANIRGVTGVLDRLVELVKKRAPDDELLIRSVEMTRKELPNKLRRNCAACLRDTIETEMEEEKRREFEAKRSKFLLRIMVSCFSDLLDESKTLHLEKRYIFGLDSYLQKFLGAVIYDEINNTARSVLHHFTIEDDAALWKAITEDHAAHRFLIDVLGRILLKFEDFDRARDTFVSIVNNNSDANKPFTEREFLIIFHRLFKVVFEFIKNDNADVIIDFRLGNGAYKRMWDIKSKASRTKQSKEWEKLL